MEFLILYDVPNIEEYNVIKDKIGATIIEYKYPINNIDRFFNIIFDIKNNTIKRVNDEYMYHFKKQTNKEKYLELDFSFKSEVSYIKLCIDYKVIYNI